MNNKLTLKMVILFLTFFCIFKNVSAVNNYEYYMGASIEPATLNDSDDQSATSIDAGYDDVHTLTKFKTTFSVSTGLTNILVEINSRGASQILVAYNAGATNPTIYATSGNEIMNVDTTFMDYPAAERVEDVHLIEKANADIG